MIFHENCLLADDLMKYHTLFFQKLGKMSQNLWSAAVVIGTLRVYWIIRIFYEKAVGLC